jgi:nucleotide-binding universal stress UspA family protein
MKLYTFKRLLVCSDLTEASDHLLKAAEQLASINDGAIEVLYVSELGLHLGSQADKNDNTTFRDVILNEFKQSIDFKFSQQLNRCTSQAKMIFRQGKVYEEVIGVAQQGQHDLIIMGHAEKSLVMQVLGSNALKVVSASPIPLLVLKNSLKLGKIAGLVDESREMERIIIGAFDLYRIFKFSEIEFVSLWMDFPYPFKNHLEKSEAESKLKDEVVYYADPKDQVVVKLEPTKELKLAKHLLEILIRDKIDLVVLKRFTEGNLRRVYLGSTTKRLLESFEGNFLILPP